MTSLLDAQGIGIASRLETTALAVATPELIAVIGPNGGGKTSLLRALARADRTQGNVAVAGESLDAALPSRRAKLVAFLPASHDIAWPIPVADFLALGGAVPTSIGREMEALDLAGLADRPMNQLSTGQRSRAMIARVLACDARLLLLDEPLSNLDPYWALRLLEILRQRASDGSIVILTLHDLSQLSKVDRILVICHGSVVADTSPQALSGSDLIEDVFEIRIVDGLPALRQRADPRSLR